MKICDILGHKYEARYDYGPPSVQYKGNDDIVSIIEASKEKTYVHDICVRCGNIVKKS